MLAVESREVLEEVLELKGLVVSIEAKVSREDEINGFDVAFCSAVVV